ncbi:OLC1v1035621C1 [Oldenlandia corymbosa var. corymbosa]|uniref:OLC1v1035621C1 n=1 Tax=Oldenlandia corymbosa var. corymbosa TaxID=529605 RepID=A0AAV1CWS9_OLDCO|nr:OLC1v1035621C1 [Oldenlandia corymbosa var. corymbosa]
MGSPDLPKNEIRISNSGQQNKYIAYGLSLLHHNTDKVVQITAMGQAISKALATMICRFTKTVPTVKITINSPGICHSSLPLGRKRRYRRKWRNSHSALHHSLGPKRTRQRRPHQVWRKASDPLVPPISVAPMKMDIDTGVVGEEPDTAGVSGVSVVNAQLVWQCNVNQTADVASDGGSQDLDHKVTLGVMGQNVFNKPNSACNENTLQQQCTHSPYPTCVSAPLIRMNLDSSQNKRHLLSVERPTHNRGGDELLLGQETKLSLHSGHQQLFNAVNTTKRRRVKLGIFQSSPDTDLSPPATPK